MLLGKNNSTNRRIIVSFLLTILFLSVVTVNAQTKKSSEKSGKVKTSKISDQLSVKQTITASALASELKRSKFTKPLVLQVGFSFLYSQGHITGAKYAGAASSKEGIGMIKNAVKSVPKNKEIVIYCGCCPWSDCPNIRPAYKTLVDLGYTNVKALYLPNDFSQDWKEKGYPVTK
ncbi:MAG: rhodanese-like domain-containing protein [Ignavibacteriaceae bacterium]